jgi:hypothetical protein
MEVGINLYALVVLAIFIRRGNSAFDLTLEIIMTFIGFKKAAISWTKIPPKETQSKPD